MFIQNYEDLSREYQLKAEAACRVGQKVLDLKFQAHPELVKLFEFLCIDLSVKTGRQIEILEVKGEVFMNFRTERISMEAIKAVGQIKPIVPQMAGRTANMTEERIRSQWRW